MKSPRRSPSSTGSRSRAGGLLPRRSPYSAATPSERDRFFLAAGILLGSAELRAKLLAHDQLPGEMTDLWRWARVVARRPERFAQWVCQDDPGQLPPGQRVLRKFQVDELQRRLKLAEFRLSRYRQLLPEMAAEAAEDARTCEELVRVLRGLFTPPPTHST